ncbi:MAG: hypothetical protein IIB38_04790, partial [Candidatus Hydrogenedentes bacterium]|nr:hypothetical protein [Candidatus Hydrogenedentota bacterium]
MATAPKSMRHQLRTLALALTSVALFPSATQAQTQVPNPIYDFLADAGSALADKRSLPASPALLEAAREAARSGSRSEQLEAILLLGLTGQRE